jgi:hypothetical protein
MLAVVVQVVFFALDGIFEMMGGILLGWYMGGFRSTRSFHRTVRTGVWMIDTLMIYLAQTYVCRRYNVPAWEAGTLCTPRFTLQ